jgi:hypothetical protein
LLRSNKGGNDAQSTIAPSHFWPLQRPVEASSTIYLIVGFGSYIIFDITFQRTPEYIIHFASRLVLD